METISLARGRPGPELLADEELADCARTVLERDGKTLLSYGAAGRLHAASRPDRPSGSACTRTAWC